MESVQSVEQDLIRRVRTYMAVHWRHPANQVPLFSIRRKGTGGKKIEGLRRPRNRAELLPVKVPRETMASLILHREKGEDMFIRFWFLILYVAYTLSSGRLSQQQGGALPAKQGSGWDPSGLSSPPRPLLHQPPSTPEEVLTLTIAPRREKATEQGERPCSPCSHARQRPTCCRSEKVGRLEIRE